MTIEPEDIRRMATLGAFEVDEASLPELAAQIRDILLFVGQLRDSVRDSPADGFRPGPSTAPLRPDTLGGAQLHSPPSAFAPDYRDGFFLVPRVRTLGEK